MDIQLLILSILISFLPGVIGVMFMGNQQLSKWYMDNKPSFTPPGYVFPIAWNILYFLLGVSLYITASYKNPDWLIIGLYSLNLILNALWTPVFFRFRMFYLGYVLIISMIIVTSMIIISSSPSVSSTSKLLLIPYVMWLSFASLLNLHFVMSENRN